MKKIKMAIYGEPGVGKSVFACHAPNPFFVCTDGNYEWLEDWGAKEENHAQVFTWEQAKKVFTMDFSKYDTIVVDLLEDLFKWCEFEWCQKNGVEHVSDKGYAKGYDITRNEFFIEISKLLALDKNIILIMHGITTFPKDRRGVEYTKYSPSNRLPDKVIDMIEGRVRYFLRVFAKTEEDADGNLVTKRYLSLSPDGTTEFGITRGLTGEVPRFIPLDWETFYTIVTQQNSSIEKPRTVVNKIELPTLEEVEVPKATRGRKPKVEEPKVEELKVEEVKVEEPSINVPEMPVVEEKAETPVVEESKPVEEAPKAASSNEDRIAAIKAKLAALKNSK